MEQAAHPPIREITFGNGNVASLLAESPETAVSDMVALLPVPRPAPVVVVAGGADSFDQRMARRLRRLFDRAVIPAGSANGALFVDGGTAAGVMAILGEAAASREPRPPLVGVAPARRVTYPGDGTPPGDVMLDENHTHFVLADGDDWGDETGVLMDLVEAIADRSAVVTIIAGGGDGTLEEALQAVRRGWPLIVLEGTGGAADSLASILAEDTAQRADSHPGGVLAEIVGGEIDVFPIEDDPTTLGRLVARRLQRDASLRLAWEQFARFDRSALRHQRNARRMQRVILGFGILGTALALTQAQLEADVALDSFAEGVLRYSILLVPIILTALIAAAGRANAATKWVVLRGTAESIKSQIYRFRSRAGRYGGAEPVATTAQVELAAALGEITSTAMQSEINLAALGPYEGTLPPPDAVRQGDDGFSRLGPDRYVEVRLLHQLDWYRRKTVTLEERMRRLRWSIIAIGAVGTFLAAIGLELWIALTTAVAGAAATYLQFEQVENTLRYYNQAAAALDTIHQWWVSLPVQQQLVRENADQLVERTERILQTEQTGWTQRMQEALAGLRDQTETTSDETDDNVR
jgi:predicted Rossmann-fold nucleotide-binding protein